MVNLDYDELEAARRRLQSRAASQPATTASPRGFSSAPPETPKAAPRPSAARRAFSAVTGSGVARAAGRAFSAVDKPLSERLNIRIPEMRGPLDEIGNTVLQEATRPTNLAFAAGGAGAATKLATLGRAGKVAAAIVSPAGGKSFVPRVASEAAVSVGARAGASAAEKSLPENTPTAVRAAVGLGAGVIGGAGAIGATRSAARAAVGRDVLSPSLSAQPLRPEVKGSLQTAEAVPQKGVLLSARTQDHLGPDYTVDDALKVGLELSKQSDAQANRLFAMGDNAMRGIGKTYTDDTGNIRVKGATYATGPHAGEDARLQTLLEYPDRFTMTPEQRPAIDRLSAIPQSVKAERDTFGAGPDIADLEMGQNFIPRKAKTDSKGVELSGAPKTGGRRLGGGKDRSRQFNDPDEAMDAGVVYDHPLHAIDEYARRGLKLAADAHVKELLVPFSETSAMRVPPGLRAQHDGLLLKLRGLRETETRLDERGRAVLAAYENANEPDIDALFVELDGITVRGSGVNGGKDAEEVRAAIDAVKDEIKALRPAWKQAQAQSKGAPVGRASVPQEVAPALIGRDFDAADAKAIEKFYSFGIPHKGQVGAVQNVVKRANKIFIPLRAIGDASALLNQLGAIAPSNPLTFGKNLALSLRDSISPAAYERYLETEAADAAAHGVAIMGRAVNSSDFEFGSWVEHIPVLKQTQRQFQAVTTRNRVDIYNSFVRIAEAKGQPLSDLDKEQVGRALNRLSGIANGRAGDIESMSFFAPNFLRSGIETVWTAAKDGTIEGSLARQYLRNLALAGQSMVLAAAYIDGRDVREVMNPIDVKALGRGELRLNSNFGTIRVAGQDVSVYGRWDSLARLVIGAADAGAGVFDEKSAKPLLEYLEYTARTKGSPTLSTGINLGTGETFTGENPLSPMGAIEQFAPFTVSDFAKDIKDGSVSTEDFFGAGVTFVGGKANPLSTFERLDNVSRALYERPYDALTAQEQGALKEQHGDLVKRAEADTERMAKSGDPKAKGRLENARLDAERIDSERKAVLAYQSGQLSEKELMDALDTLQQRAAFQKEEAQRVLGVEYGDSKLPAQQALSAWYETYRQAEVVPGTVDFDLRDQLELELYRRIGDGQYGDPTEARRFIDERKRSLHAPEAQAFFDLKDTVAESGYYDTADAAFARFQPIASRILGREVGGYGEFTAAVALAQRQGDPRTAAQLKAVQSQMQRIIDQQRLLMRAQNPELDQALFRLGRVSKTIRPVRQAL